MSERRAEKSRGPCTINGVDTVRVIGSGFANATGMGLSNVMRLVLTGTGTVSVWIASAVISLVSGLARVGAAGVWTAGVQFMGARIVEVCARGAVGSVGKAGVCARVPRHRRAG